MTAFSFIFFLTASLSLSSAEGAVAKCCPHEHIITVGGCLKGETSFEVPSGTNVTVGRPDCPEGIFSLLEYDLSHDNGTLEYEDGDGTNVRTREFCLEWSSSDNRTLPYVCFQPSEPTDPMNPLLPIYSFGLVISMPFLLATVLVYGLIERLRNFHGRCVVYHSSCLLMGYIGLAIMQNSFLQQIIICEIIGYSTQFFMLAAFTWMNVMCWDIYWSFSGSRNISGSVRERERNKLNAYSIYAWCTPLAILAVTVAVDRTPIIPDSSAFKPKVGFEKCFFSDLTGQWIYFYLPMGLILICNSYIFVVTAYKVWSIRREAEALNSADNPHRANRKDKERYGLYLKLFIVMGINWMFELISSLVDGTHYFWVITDIANSLQGVFIFIILVLKKKVRKIVWEKICDFFGKKTSSPGTMVNRTNHTNTSQSSHSTNSVEMTTQNISHLNGGRS